MTVLIWVVVGWVALSIVLASPLGYLLRRRAEMGQWMVTRRQISVAAEAVEQDRAFGDDTDDTLEDDFERMARVALTAVEMADTERVEALEHALHDLCEHFQQIYAALYGPAQAGDNGVYHRARDLLGEAA